MRNIVYFLVLLFFSCEYAKNNQKNCYNDTTLHKFNGLKKSIVLNSNSIMDSCVFYFEDDIVLRLQTEYGFSNQDSNSSEIFIRYRIFRGNNLIDERSTSNFCYLTMDSLKIKKINEQSFYLYNVYLFASDLYYGEVRYTFTKDFQLRLDSMYQGDKNRICGIKINKILLPSSENYFDKYYKVINQTWEEKKYCRYY